jgi:hypothetical protein
LPPTPVPNPPPMPGPPTPAPTPPPIPGPPPPAPPVPTPDIPTMRQPATGPGGGGTITPIAGLRSVIGSFGSLPSGLGTVVETIIDFTPIVSDIKGFAEAFENPTAVNIVSAAVGVVPGVGDVASKAIKIAGKAIPNLLVGIRRQDEVLERLKALFPDKIIQRENYLRTADGKKAIDPLTGEGRRVDFSVIDPATRTAKTVEVTGPNVNKALQEGKEKRILDSGGEFVRNRKTGELCRVEGICERIDVP